jgi:ankyrin repeat protein
MNKYTFFFGTVLIVAILATGCDDDVSTSIWKTRFNLEAEDFFDDPKVIALCKAIDAKNLRRIDRLITRGADVNAKGKDNMTPLLWAFPGDNLESFKRLLEHGANPNVVVTSNFNTRRSEGSRTFFINPGDSVLHLAAVGSDRTRIHLGPESRSQHYFKYVMQHGGDPNLIRGNPQRSSPLITVVGGLLPNKTEAVQLLIDAGADLDYRNDIPGSSTALESSVLGGHRDGYRYDVTLQLLKAGASFNIYKEQTGETFLHYFLWADERTMVPELRQRHAKILAWLEANGADMEAAREESIILNTPGIGRLSPERIAEVRQRYADELAAKQAAQE